MSQEPQFVTLQPVGELDANSSVYLDETIRQLIEENKLNIHVDFARINYISSAGMGVFVSYLEEIKSKGGKIVLSNLSANVLEVFKLLGLDQLIPIVSDKAEVTHMFKG